MINPEFALFPLVENSQTNRIFVNYREALKLISAQIEDAALKGQVRSRIFAGFQKFSFFRKSLKRYQALADSSDGIWVFGIPDETPPSIPGVTYISITPEHTLALEWFLVVDSPDFFTALVAQDLSGFDVPNPERRFRGVWTFDGDVVAHLQRGLSTGLGLSFVEANGKPERDYHRQMESISLSTTKLVDMLEKHNHQLVQAQQLQKDLASMLVHDLRSPLTVVISSLELLNFFGADLLNEKLRRFVTLSQQNAQDLNNMIGNLLDIAQLEEGKLNLSLTALSPEKLLTTAVESIQIIAERDHKTVLLEISEPLPPILGQADKVMRVFDNLLSNALKYTTTSGQITLSARTQNGYVEFAVSDNGPGIKPKAMDRIFNKFEQAGGPAQKAGSGLGLTFCKMIIEAHGGRIWVESEPKNGSTFRFTVPRV